MSKPDPVSVSEPARYRLMSDDDGHEYLIPADRRADFSAWLDSDAALDGETPEWAERLNMHRSNHSFTGWQEDA